MRTTITIDDDLAPRLDAEARRSGRSFKATVNRLLRLGLTVQQELDENGAFEVRTRPLDARTGLDFDNVGRLLEELEGPAHR